MISRTKITVIFIFLWLFAVLLAAPVIYCDAVAEYLVRGKAAMYDALSQSLWWFGVLSFVIFIAWALTYALSELDV